MPRTGHDRRTSSADTAPRADPEPSGHRRRLVGIVVATVAIGGTGPAASQRRPVRVGSLSIGSPTSHGAILGELRAGLADLGWVEGRDVEYVYAWAEGRTDRIPALAASLVEQRVDLIVTGNPVATRAAQLAAPSIPIVMGSGSDPVGNGLVASLARPGGNTTGMSNQAEALVRKLLDLAREAFPVAKRMAVMINETSPTAPTFWREAEAASRASGLVPLRTVVRRPEEIDEAIGSLSTRRADALVVLPDPVYAAEHAAIVRRVASARLPAIYPFREFVLAGGLLSYGHSIRDSYRRSAAHVDKILKGTKPGVLPIEQPTRFELVVNARAAANLATPLPRAILLRADEVIG